MDIDEICPKMGHLKEFIDRLTRFYKFFDHRLLLSRNTTTDDTWHQKGSNRSVELTLCRLSDSFTTNFTLYWSLLPDFVNICFSGTLTGS